MYILLVQFDSIRPEHAHQFTSVLLKCWSYCWSFDLLHNMSKVFVAVFSSGCMQHSVMLCYFTLIEHLVMLLHRWPCYVNVLF